MILASVAIRRPVFTAMVVMAIVVFGLIALRRIGTDLFPRVDFPVVTIVSTLPGADPETIEGTVTDPIEEAVSSISGIKSLRSTSAEDVSQVVVEFLLDKNVDVAFQEVQARLAAIRAQLPRDMEDPVVEKLDLDAQPVLTVYLGGSQDARELTRIAKDVVKVRLQQVRDVGQIRLIGGRERTMWIHLDRDRLAGYGLTVEDVVAAVRREHADIPGGRIETGVREWSVSAKGEFNTAAGFAGIIVAQRGGTALRLADLGRVEDGVQEQRSAALLDGREAVALEVRRQSGTNTVAVAQAVKAAIGRLQAELKPQGIELRIAKDTSLYIEQSIHEIQFHLIIGGLFAVITVYLFLRSLRITMIAALAIPTAVMGAFACIQAFGFTLNMMTMLALTLSIGILIDDAIVVIENIYRRYEGGLPALEAADQGTAEIGPAAVAITLSIVAVFVPVAFMDGIVGRFFFQFGITVTAAVLLSLFVAFTLTPSLAARVLGGHGHGRFYLATERLFTAIEGGYAGLVRRALRWRWATLALAILALVGALVAARGLRSEFTPVEDQSEFVVLIKAPVGTPLATTRAVAERVRAACSGQPWLEYAAAVVGGVELGRVNEGTVYVKLRDRSVRTMSQQAAMVWMREHVAGEQAATLAVEAVPRVSGGGFKNAAVQLEIRGRDLDAVQRTAQGLMAELRKRSGYVDIDTSWEGGKPEVDLRIDRERAAQLGVAVAGVGSTVRWLVGGDKVGTFRAEGSRYDVRLRLAESQRGATADIGDLAVRGAGGRLVALRDVVRPEEVQGPSQINRYSRTRQVTVYANLDGSKKVLGEAIAETTQILQGMQLPPGITFGFAGQAEVMGESFANLIFAIGLAVVMVYMVLASQFESFWQPLVIMLSLPLSLVGALGLIVITGQTMSIFVMIGIIMLFGLVTKNAILLVDFTNTLRRRDGLERDAALAKAGGVRLRPILMTTLAMIAGMAPVALGTGAGAESRAPMAIAVIGGLVASTLLTLVVVPVVYSLTDALLTRLRRRSS